MSTELLPCPFCGSPAKMIVLSELPEDDPNWNGAYIECCNAVCRASTNIHFGEYQDILREKWNRRAAPATSDATARNPNSGHGHVFPRPDGVRARCGGPGICPECAIDAARGAK